MRVPYSWLQEFVPLSAPVDEVADRLTMRGLEVEGLERITPAFSNVVVGEILEIERHPSADKLLLCRVDVGGGGALPIVCGAPNVARGQRVPVAVPGARLADGTIIEKRSLRGVDSYGMLCSEKELGLSDDHSGIFILPDRLTPGNDLGNLLEITDHVLDVNVPPNRGDCQSILGVAREAASIFGVSVTLPSAVLDEKEDIDGRIDLLVLDRDACPRYVLRMIRDISIVPSPYWMRSRIIKAGMRPINSIVDVTNYVMLELGQPLHAFDYARIGSRKIEVKTAREKSVFRTLDGTDRNLEKGDLLICDGSGPIALAGVMGGENSEISESTTDVALESAFFNPLLIRRTARRLDLRSEASSRFEKGVDPENVDYCAMRAIDLMQKTAGGTIIRGPKEFYDKREQRFISLSLKRTEEIVGMPLEPSQILDALHSIGVGVAGTDGERTVFSVPSYRHDLVEDFDLIEEVARVVGYSTIPVSAPVGPLLPVTREKRDIDIDSTKDYLVSCGFFEVVNFGFFDSKDIKGFGIREDDDRSRCVSIMNPISKELGVMRTFLAPGVLENVAYNANRGTKNLKLFEVGKAFVNAEGEELPRESVSVCCALSGKEREYFWRDSLKELDFYDLKGVLEGLFERFMLALTVRKTTEPFLDSAVSADLYLGERKVGWMGEVIGSVLDAYDIREKVLCAELNLDAVTAKGTQERTYSPVPRYPSAIRDFSFYVDDTVSVGSLIEMIKEVSPLIALVGVFDIFKKEERSISFRVIFQSFEDTLTDEAVTNLQQIIIDRLTKIEGIKLRT